MLCCARYRQTADDLSNEALTLQVCRPCRSRLSLGPESTRVVACGWISGDAAGVAPRRVLSGRPVLQVASMPLVFETVLEGINSAMDLSV